MGSDFLLADFDDSRAYLYTSSVFDLRLVLNRFYLHQ